MKANIKEYLPFYIGQKFQVLKTGEIGTFDFFFPKAKEKIGTYNLVKSDYEMSQVKLILLPMSSISKKDSKQINTLSKKFDSKKGVQQPTGLFEITRYLCKKGYDVFNLRKKNLCFYKEDLLPAKK